MPVRLLLGSGLAARGRRPAGDDRRRRRLGLDDADPGLRPRRRRHRPDQPAARLDRDRRRAARAQRHGLGHQRTFRQVGIATGIAGLGAIFQHSVTASTTAGSRAAGHAPGNRRRRPRPPGDAAAVGRSHAARRARSPPAAHTALAALLPRRLHRSVHDDRADRRG